MEIGSKVHELVKRIRWQFHIGDLSEVCMLTFVPVMKGFTLWSGFLSSLFVCGQRICNKFISRKVYEAHLYMDKNPLHV